MPKLPSKRQKHAQVIKLVPMAGENTKPPSSTDSALRPGRWQTDHEARKRDAFTLRRITIRRPEWNYLVLDVISSSPRIQSSEALIDILTLKTHLTAALSRFLGQTGSAMGLDILHLTPTPPPSSLTTNTVFRLARAVVRTHRDDANVLMAATGAYTGTEGVADLGFRICGKGAWLGALTGALAEAELWK